MTLSDFCKNAQLCLHLLPPQKKEAVSSWFAGMKPREAVWLYVKLNVLISLCFSSGGRPTRRWAWAVSCWLMNRITPAWSLESFVSPSSCCCCVLYSSGSKEESKLKVCHKTINLWDISCRQCVHGRLCIFCIAQNTSLCVEITL